MVRVSNHHRKREGGISPMELDRIRKQGGGGELTYIITVRESGKRMDHSDSRVVT